ncbi:MAG TPA: UDP-N-acetylmuramoyl-L-alanyl-D-glutamate--2,6-diaminopimelate ligase [Candidatus Paceibacterota bacterium]|nr:UDP-N-acetylmuramoyl-L-alanyl-D-glutamate--2,6-diaminopimelate ligase [Candidatus Paceibacterota bacterium]
MFLFDLIKNIYHFLWAFFSALFCGFPSRHLKVIGITGTKGKSTVSEMISKILEEADFRVASLDSIKIKVDKNEEENLFKMTTPGRGYLQTFLKRATKAHCHYAIIEITSEGILQHRQKFINFDTVVFTNLSPEHIERHGSFENYRAAKGKLFKENKKNHILNLDDANIDYFLQFPAEKKIGFTLKDSPKGADKIIKGKDLKIKEMGSEFFVEIYSSHYEPQQSNPETPASNQNEITVKDKSSSEKIELKLPGVFNVYNALCAIAIGFSQNVSLSICKRALEKIEGVPGRMEMVIKEPFKVIVDYAHTPDSLKEVYETLRNQNSKLICVLGSCGGGRDKWKRPKMGEIAAKYCDEIIITNEDPYDEDPLQIMKQVASGIKSKKHYLILDRREAINKALSLANTNDVVVITGKGCEPWMCVANGKKIPWDDREIAREEFKKISHF